MKNFDYLKDVLGRLERELNAMAKEDTHKALSAHEMACVAFVRELELAAPRIREDVIQVSQKRRRELSEGE